MKAVKRSLFSGRSVASQRKGMATKWKGVWRARDQRPRCSHIMMATSYHETGRSHDSGGKRWAQEGASRMAGRGSRTGRSTCALTRFITVEGRAAHVVRELRADGQRAGDAVAGAAGVDAGRGCLGQGVDRGDGAGDLGQGLHGGGAGGLLQRPGGGSVETRDAS